MKIHIANIGLTGFFDRKSDIIYGLFHALSSLGHDVSVGHNTFESHRLNLIIGSDIISNHTSMIDALARSKYDYTIYEVENFNGLTINYLKEFNLENYERLLRHAKFVITPYKYNLPSLKQICTKNTPVEYVKWGFHDRMVDENINRSGTYKYQALFFGLLKGTRIEKCNFLAEHFGKNIQFIDDKMPFTIRAYYISACKIGLSLSYGKNDNFVNPFRIMCMLANGMPVLADHSVDQDGYLDWCENHNYSNLAEAVESHYPNQKEVEDRCHANRLIDELKRLF